MPNFVKIIAIFKDSAHDMKWHLVVSKHRQKAVSPPWEPTELHFIQNDSEPEIYIEVEAAQRNIRIV